MEHTIQVLKMWYSVCEPFNTDVKSSIIESTIDNMPDTLFKVACIFHKNGLSATELKKWICHKDFFGDLEKTAGIYDKLTPGQKAALRIRFVIDVNNEYSMKMPNNEKGVLVL